MGICSSWNGCRCLCGVCRSVCVCVALQQLLQQQLLQGGWLSGGDQLALPVQQRAVAASASSSCRALKRCVNLLLLWQPCQLDSRLGLQRPCSSSSSANLPLRCVTWSATDICHGACRDGCVTTDRVSRAPVSAKSQGHSLVLSHALLGLVLACLGGGRCTHAVQLSLLAAPLWRHVPCAGHPRVPAWFLVTGA